MRAVVFNRYGPPEVLQLQERERPLPGTGEVRVRVRATTVTPADVMLRSGKFPLLFWLPARILYGVVRPRRLVPGYELAGEVDAVGRHVRLFRAGDQVFGASMWRMSCSAEYICLPETAALAPKPAGLSHGEAVALVDGACTALHFLRKAGLRKGQEVLVYGASGGVGSAAVQLARHFGAVVAGLCSTANVELVRALGADEVIDYKKQSLSRIGRTYDVIFDAAGKAPLAVCVKALKPGGIYLSTVLPLFSNLRAPWIRLATGKRIAGGLSTSSASKLHYIKEIAERGELRPVIDRVYPLADIVQAHRHVSEGHKRGTVVIEV
jgi:NADPH:quinone reductase-like Zn-dependent oxidoreductase